MIAVAIILILSSILYSNLHTHLVLTRETAVVRQIAAIHQAQAQYYAQFGRFARSLAELGPSASGAPGPGSADLLPKTLAEGKTGGYIYAVSEAANGYSVNADPEAFGTSGRRTFYSDQTLIVRNNWSAEPASPASPELK